MNISINQVIPKEVWEWLDNLDDMEDIEETVDNDSKNGNGDGITDDSINGELYNAFSRTFELIVSPYIDEVDAIISSGIPNSFTVKLTFVLARVLSIK